MTNIAANRNRNAILPTTAAAIAPVEICVLAADDALIGVGCAVDTSLVLVKDVDE